jgi:ABC-type metal ion transport system substrate-binding protein
MSLTTRFIKAFDPTNEHHVLWLQTMMHRAENLGEMNNLVKDINENPMKLKISDVEALDWPHVHFVLGMAYAKAVLKGQAYIPNK